MLSSSFLMATTAALLAISLPTIQACANHGGNMTASEQLVIGDDGPADAATIGFNVNHFALNVNDLEASMHFYGKVLGMRHIFTYHISPVLDLAYMGFSVGGKNGTQYQTGEELYKQKTNTAGIIELLHRKNCNSTTPGEPVPASTKKSNTFSHVGLIVPDMMAAQDRMKQFNVTILKEIGVEPAPRGPLANAFNVGDVTDAEGEEIVAGLDFIGFKYALIVEDPDGNIIEILPQD